MAAALKAYRRYHPYCQSPGCHRLSEQTDHITPLAEGGDRYDFTNMQALCLPHHKQKTVADAQRGKTRAR